MKKINVLSLCDGMSCGQIALKELNIPVLNYYASEIEKDSIKVTQDNFPQTIQIGDVNKIDSNFLKSLPTIDLVMFGFPCRSLTKTTAGHSGYDNGLNGVSGLFYKCNEILQWIINNNNNQVKFLVENVDTYHKNDMQVISSMLNVEPVLIDSNLFSAQDRKRFYWTNIQIKPLPKSNPLVIKDILDDEVDEKYFYNYQFTLLGEDKKVCATLSINCYDMGKRVNNVNYKCPTLTACRGGYKHKKIYMKELNKCRKLTPNEYRKLQTIPNWYKMEVSDSAIYNMCGDGWTIDVIKHILSSLNEPIIKDNSLF